MARGKWIPRERSFDDLIGQGRLVSQIRKHIKKLGTPKAWMFSGHSGCGKTTIARILALSLNCDHQKKFGNPCRECRHKKSQLEIQEINAGEYSSAEVTRKIVS